MNAESVGNDLQSFRARHWRTSVLFAVKAFRVVFVVKL